MSQVKVVRHKRPAPRDAARPAPVAARNGQRRAVAIAASTGGPAVLHHLLSTLPADFPAPILVVHHRPAGSPPGLVPHLNASSSRRGKVAGAGDGLTPQAVYLAP